MMHKRWYAVCAAILLFALLCPFLTVAADETTVPETVRRQYAEDELVCTYTFTVYGYGHGVGLSQVGAAVYGDTNGRFRWNYVQILMHYYPQTHMAYEEDVPQTMRWSGGTYNTRELLAHSTFAEIGGYCTENRREAVKAQIVAIYSFLKNHGYAASSGGIAYTGKTPPAVVYACVDEVYGQYVAYADGSAAPGLYAASTAGWTTSSATAWGGQIRGLEGGVYSPETVSVTTVTMDARDIVAIANVYNAGRPDSEQIHLTGDPSGWLEVLEHDGRYSDGIGYVTKLRIGDRTMGGSAFRTLLFRVPDVPNLRCHCFKLTYDLQPGDEVRGNDADAFSVTETETEAQTQTENA